MCTPLKLSMRCGVEAHIIDNRVEQVKNGNKRAEIFQLKIKISIKIEHIRVCMHIYVCHMAELEVYLSQSAVSKGAEECFGNPLEILNSIHNSIT